MIYAEGDVVIDKVTKIEMTIITVLPPILANGKQLLYCDYLSENGLEVLKSFTIEQLLLRNC
jgi:hypothetical protein